MVFIERFDGATRCHVQHMTNKGSRLVRHQKKSPTPFGWIIALMAVVLVAILYAATRPNSQVVAPVFSIERETERYIRSQVTTNEVLPGFEPAAIYYKRPGMSNEVFSCVGTLFHTLEVGPQVISSGHLFRNDLPTTQIISMRTLRGISIPEVTYIHRILFSGENPGRIGQNKLDVFVAAVQTTPYELPPYSQFKDGEIVQHLWGDVIVNERKLTKFRSILSGKEYEGLGFSKTKSVDGDILYVLIDKNSVRGESGTGFVDEFGGIWVLHGTPSGNETAVQIRDDYHKLTGKQIQGVTALSGPLFGNYK